MRLWSLHPRYLDRQGLLAVWREGLLAQKVLAGKTIGYRHHPQLVRFREARDPLLAIGIFLHHIVLDAERRGYRFEKTKILKPRARSGLCISVKKGQVEFEARHLLRKLKVRDPAAHKELRALARWRVHPLFRVVRGEREAWERA
jgi:hypothetical protein